MFQLKFASLALLSVLGFVPELSAQGVTHGDYEDLEAVLEAMPDSEMIRDVEYYDMSRNGYDEALVTMDRNCTEDGFCDWMLFALTDDGWRAVGNGSSRDVHFESTEDGGAVLSADDILWAYSGDQSVYMWGDLLSGMRPEEATRDEYLLVAEKTKYKEPAYMRLERYEVDLNGDGSPERIFMVRGIHYKAGQWGTPYVIVDRNDDIVLTSVTTDLPRIFPKSDAPGSYVVNLVPAGLQVNEVN